MEEALDKVFRVGKQGGLPRRLCPRLTGLREEVQEGAYTLVLEFESKLEEPQWQERQPKIQSFFGPGAAPAGAHSAAGIVHMWGLHGQICGCAECRASC